MASSSRSTSPIVFADSDVFSSGGGRKTATDMKLNFLGALPLDPHVRIGGDTGHPIATLGPEDPHAKDFYELTQLKIANPTTGLLMIGGGVPKNFAQDIVVAADILGTEAPMHKYAVQITVADVRDGALSSSTRCARLPCSDCAERGGWVAGEQCSALTVADGDRA